MAPNLPPKNRGGTPPAKTTDAFGGKSFNGDGKDPEYPGDGPALSIRSAVCENFSNGSGPFETV